MTSQTATKPTNYRRIANTSAGYLAVLFSVLGLVQIALAGAGAAGLDFDMHVMLGRMLSAVAILVAVLALAGHHSRTTMGMAVVLVALAAGTSAILAGLGWHGQVAIGVHALSGVVAVIVAGQLGKRMLGKPLS